MTSQPAEKTAPDLAPERLGQGLYVDLERDGESLVVLGADGVVSRLSGEGLSPLGQVPGARAAAGRGPLLLAAVDTALVRLTADGVQALAEADSPLLDLALSPSGELVAGADLAGRVHLWHAATGRVVGELPGHTERAVAVEFLPDGDLASGSWDGTVRTWALSTLTRPVPALIDEIEAAWGDHPRGD